MAKIDVEHSGKEMMMAHGDEAQKRAEKRKQKRQRLTEEKDWCRDVLPLVVGCYTAGDYAKEAEEQLIASVRALGLPYAIREIPNRGSWVLNNSACQLYLLDLHNEMPDTSFLYVDVDGYIRQDPWPFLKELDCDVAAYFLDDKELLSGTLYLPATDRRRELLTRWISKNQQQPDVWDQKHLQTLLNQDKSFKLAKLPAEYCCIFDLQRRRTPDIVPVVEHFQASRRFKKNVCPVTQPEKKAPVAQADLTDPLVSMLMPAHASAAPWVEKAIRSVFNQVYSNIELCLVIDGPSPEIEAICKEMIDENKGRKFVWGQLPKVGYAVAMNAAFAFATGDIIARLDSDDLQDPTRIERQVRYLQSVEEEVVAVSCDWGWMDVNDKETRRWPSAVPLLKDYLARNARWCIGSIVAWKSVWDYVGLFSTNPEVVRAADSEWAMRVLTHYKIGHINQCLYWQRRRPGQMSEEPLKLQQAAFKLAASWHSAAAK